MPKRLGTLVGILSAAAVALLTATPVLGSHGGAYHTQARVSVASTGTQGDDMSFVSSISADGRYVVFHSYATNLVSGDTNAQSDVFVHDRQAGTTDRISLPTTGGQGNSTSAFGSVSSDGRYIAFESSSSNLVTGDTNNTSDIFIRDRQAGTTARVSVSSVGDQGNNSSYQPSLSADGRFVAFRSSATNFAADDTNGVDDVFVHDRLTGVTERVSVSSAGAQGDFTSSRPSISADGRYVAFRSASSTLVGGDENGTVDIFVRDRQAGSTERVNISDSEEEANSASDNPAISADGNYVTFVSIASNLVAGDTNSQIDIFVRDRLAGTTERVNVSSTGDQANTGASLPAISGDGRYVTFFTPATNLVTDDTNGNDHVFVHDRQTGTTELVSVAGDGTAANQSSTVSKVSFDGSVIAFDSLASNLVAADTNSTFDAFVTTSGAAAPANNAPVVEAAPSRTLLYAQRTWTLQLAAFTDPDEGDNHTATIDWGDGSQPSAGAVDEQTGEVTDSHRYTAPGNYTVTVTVQDGSEAEDSDSFQVVVRAHPRLRR